MYTVHSIENGVLWGDYLGLTAGTEKDEIAYVWFRNKDGRIEHADSYDVVLKKEEKT